MGGIHEDWVRNSFPHIEVRFRPLKAPSKTALDSPEEASASVRSSFTAGAAKTSSYVRPQVANYALTVLSKLKSHKRTPVPAKQRIPAAPANGFPKPVIHSEALPV